MEKEYGSPSPKREERRTEQKKHTDPVKRRINILMIVLFVVVAAAFFVGMIFTASRTYSVNENRTLASLPKFSLGALADGSYFSGLSDYYTDHFPLRDAWITLKLAEDVATGKQESHDVFLGSGGRLFDKPEDPVEENVSALADAVNRFSSGLGEVRVHFLLVPCAAAVMPDRLPANAPVRDQLADIRDFYGRIGDSANCLDAASVMLAHTDEDIYYHTDHHWTSYGASLVFDAVADALGITDKVPGYDIYTVTDSFRGTLSSQSGSLSQTDTIEVYAPQTDVRYYVYYPDTKERTASMYESEYLDAKDQYAVFFGGNHAITELHTTANTGKNLLMFKDSYANCFIQFLTPYYDTITMIDPRYYYGDPASVIEAGNITDVLFLYSANTLYTDTTLTDCLNAST